MAVFEQYITGDDANAGAWGDVWFAQTFKPSTAHTCVGVNLYLGISNTPGELTVSIRATSGGLPTGADLISGTIPAVDINSIVSNQWLEVGFGAGLALAANTTYAVVLRALDGSSGTDDINWRYDSSSPTYTNGSKIDSTDAGVGWTADTGGDFMFQERSGAVIHEHLQGNSNAENNVDGANWISQAFTTTSSYNIYGISLSGEKGDTGITTITASIRAVDGNDQPTGADLAVGTYDGTQLGTAHTWFNIIFTTPYLLSAATTYAIVVRCASSSPDDFEWSHTSADTYQRATSTDSGSSWTSQIDGQLFKTYSGPKGSPASDLIGTKKLVSIAGGDVWDEDSPGTMSIVSATSNQLDPATTITVATGFGKVFIANDSKLRVLDYSSVKLNTTSLGANPPDIGTVLTGGTSGAKMSVEYITALTGDTNLYGFRTTAATFESGETITGTDDDSNAISFTLSAAEVAGPHWYNWTVFGNDSSFGVMPDQATLVSRYRGRMVLSGNSDYPHQWYMSKIASPFNWLYGINDPLSAIAGNNTEAGEIGDIVRALIPYGDDFLVFGCADSIHLLDGDPAIGGVIDEIDNSTGIHSPFSWAKDSAGSLYFWGQEGLYKMQGGRTKPDNIGQEILPKWADDWAADPALHRIVLTFDRRRNGVIISKTTLADGTNLNYWFNLKTEGLYPETYPTAAGIYCSYDYKSNTPANAGLILGCTDGYLRHYLDTAKDDDSGDTDTAVSSYVVLGPFPLGDGADIEGKLKQLVFESAGGASGGVFGDSDGFSYDVHVANDAETCIEDIKDGATPVYTGTVSGAGRTNRIRPRLRGMYYAVRVYNATASETFVLNRVLVDRINAGRMRS